MRKLLVLLSLGVLFASSCSLKEERDSFVNRENAYGTAAQCKSVLNSCYMPIKNIVTSSYFLMTEACNDLWSSSISIPDATLNISPANPGAGSNIWSNGYKGVMWTNECIACIAKSPLEDAVKQPMVAEARALRALYYYVLTCTFGDVPFYTNMIEDVDGLKAVAALPKESAANIRSALYDDLHDNAIPFFTAENGLKARPDQVPQNRAGYALSLMLMSRFALWNKDYDAAIEALDLLEELYGELTEERYPLEQTMWRYKNTPESIFEIQQSWSVDGVQYGGSIAPICLPIYDGDGIFDGVPLSGLGVNNSSKSTVVTTARFAILRSKSGAPPAESSAFGYSLIRPIPLTFDDEYYTAQKRYYVKIDTEAVRTWEKDGQKLDRRILYTFGLGNLQTGETFNTVRNNGNPCTGPKFWCPDMVSNHDSNNYKFFRYADAVLSMAEAWCCKGDTEKALHYLNLTRIRAGIEPLGSTAEQEDIMSEIRDERARELGGEMHRKFDLVRWGIWYSETQKYQSKKVKLNMLPCHEYYPIPDNQCALGGYVLKNEAYAAYADKWSQSEDENEEDS